MQGQKSKEFIIKPNDEEVKLYFKRPTMAQIFDMDLEYRKTYAEALRQGIATEAEVRKKSLQTGAWTQEDQDKISDLSLEIAKLEAILNGSQDKDDENVKIAERIGKTRRDLIYLISQRTSLLSNTSEDLSNQYRMHKFIELCCCKSDGENFFESREDYEKFVLEHPDEASEIFKQSFLYEYNTSEDITESWGEVKYFKRMLEKEKAKIEQKKEEVKSEVST